MKIQLNTDLRNHGTEALAGQVSVTLERALKRFEGHISRVEVHLSEENGGKDGQHNQRCLLETRLGGPQAAAATNHAANLLQAGHGAAPKLARLLDSTFGLLHDHRKKTSRLPLSGTEPSNGSDSPVE